MEKPLLAAFVCFLFFGCVDLFPPWVAWEIDECKNLSLSFPYGYHGHGWGYRQGDCLYDVAQKYDDPRICDEISVSYYPGFQRKCYNQIAMKTSNPELCRIGGIPPGNTVSCDGESISDAECLPYPGDYGECVAKSSGYDIDSCRNIDLMGQFEEIRNECIAHGFPFRYFIVCNAILENDGVSWYDDLATSACMKTVEEKS